MGPQFTRLLDTIYVKPIGSTDVQPMILTTDHASSSYGIPVLIPRMAAHRDGKSYGPGDVVGQAAQCGSPAICKELVRAGFKIVEDVS